MATSGSDTQAKVEAKAQDAEATNAQVQAKVDEEQAKGYFGQTPDPTPNENYTVAGVTSGAEVPTPAQAAALAREFDSTKQDEA